MLLLHVDVTQPCNMSELLDELGVRHGSNLSCEIPMQHIFEFPPKILSRDADTRPHSSLFCAMWTLILNLDTVAYRTFSGLITVLYSKTFLHCPDLLIWSEHTRVQIHFKLLLNALCFIRQQCRISLALQYVAASSYFVGVVHPRECRSSSQNW